VACKAISSAPVTVPALIAASAHQKGRPISMTTPPSTTLNTFTFAPNQKASCCPADPCRAFRGMNSMWCRSAHCLMLALGAGEVYIRGLPFLTGRGYKRG
jgi:hypothetical protein